jgi:hypothetical protein
MKWKKIKLEKGKKMKLVDYINCYEIRMKQLKRGHEYNREKKEKEMVKRGEKTW